MIEQPGLQDDKLDASISIRGTEGVNYYIARRNQTSNAPFTITCGFRPKAVHVVATSLDVRWPDFFSKSYTCEIDGVLTTTMFYKNFNTMIDYGTGVSSSVYCMFHDPFLDPLYTRRMTISEFTDTGVRFDPINIGGDDYSLAITIIR